ncbi:GyrI-like domain-containing protein [Gemmobacter lutimaris]|uniref:GyrI-like domain-containing protein n=1 Tax=Gemmobacter lutimaris TaxID=2306023 RepID=A0A398BRH1_9RHOB|nr:GyrI-like domain-containing protein [Gemmobacter lutimaris]RID93205.1 GyrI-like domain-containing protein [Gemmobacter lutimaris]
MTFTVDIRAIPETRIAALPYKGPYNQVGPLFRQAADLVSVSGLWPMVQAAAMIGYDNPRVTAPEACRAHAGFVVAPGFPIHPPFDEVLYPAGRHAVVLVKGPYTNLPEAYRWLADDWYPASGEKHAGRVAYEVYLNDPSEVAEEDLLTEVRLPLAGQASTCGAPKRQDPAM